MACIRFFVLFFFFLFLSLPVNSSRSRKPDPDSCYIHNCLDCFQDVDCPDNYACSLPKVGLGKGFCYVLPFFFEYSWRHITGSILVFGAAIFAGGTGGMGSGGLFITIMFAVMGLRPSVAIGVTQATLLGSALAALFLFIRTPHPIFPERTPFDFNTVLILFPTIVIGCMVGVYFHLTCPTWFILIFLGLISALACYRSIKTVVGIIRAEEKLAIKQANYSDESEAEDSNKLMLPSGSMNFVNRAADGYIETDAEIENQAEYLSTRTKFSPARLRFALPPITWKIVVTAIIFVSGILIAFFRSGRHGKSIVGVEVCSKVFWILSAIQIPVAVIILLLVLYLIHREQSRPDVMHAIAESEIVVTSYRSWSYPLQAFGVGLMSSMIGFGGVVMFSPLFSDLKVHRLVVTGTSALIHVFISVFSVVNFEVTGILLGDYAGWFALLAFVGQLIGHLVVHPAVKKLKPRVVAIIVTIIVLASVIVLISFSVLDIMEDFKLSHNVNFQWFC